MAPTTQYPSDIYLVEAATDPPSVQPSVGSQRSLDLSGDPVLPLQRHHSFQLVYNACVRPRLPGVTHR